MNQSNDTLDFYDDDYLHFSSYTLGPERTENEVAFIRQVLGIGSNDAVLGLGCGHGRIANGLAQHGARVTGIEILPLFLARARADAAGAGLSVDYRQADMRDAISAGPFDAAIIWFFAFGYHSDDDNRRVLQNVSNVLKPGGKLLLDQYNISALARAADHYTVLDLESSLLIQRPVCDLEAGRWGAERIVVRDGAIRRSRFTCRCYTPIELSRMLADAGFEIPNFFGDGFKKLELDSTRLIAAATKSANPRG